MRKLKPDPCRFWCRVRWGILATHPKCGPMLIGVSWHIQALTPAYFGEPARLLLFETRQEARDWIKARPYAAAHNPKPRKVRERVELA